MTEHNMAVRALLFDLWGTLIIDSPQREEPRQQTRLRLVRQALAEAGEARPEAAVAAGLEALTGVYRTSAAVTSMAERVQWLLEQIETGLAERLSPEGLRAVEDAVAGAIRHSPPLAAPGAAEALVEARGRGLALGLVSNTGLTPGYVLREILADYGLLSHLQVLTFSDEAGLAKPAPEVFQCTLDALGVAPPDAVFTGDLPTLDVAGPLAVGMWTVQVGTEWADGVKPHARIDSLTELFPALERLGLVGS